MAAGDKYVGFVDIGDGKNQPIGSTLYGTCGTAAGTAAKVVTMAAFDKLETGVTIHVKFTYSNTADNATLNVNGTGAKDLCSYGTTRVGKTTASSWQAGAVVSFTYDGTSWVMNDYIADNNSDTKVTQTVKSDNNSYPLLLAPTGQTTTQTTTACFGTAFQANPSTGNLTATKFNSYTLGAACEKSLGTVTDGSAGLVTGDQVYDAIQDAMGTATGSMVYKGPVSSAASLENVAMKKGYVYMADTAFTITDSSSIVHGVEIGDMIIFNADGNYATDSALWAAIDLYQTNMDRLTDSDIDSAIAAAEAA